MFGLRRKGTTTLADLASRVAGWMGYGTLSGMAVNEVTAVEVTAVFAAARVIAEGLGQMPIRLMQENFADTTARRVIARDHWAHHLLAVRPNSWQTPFEFIEGMSLVAALGRGSIAIKVVVGQEVRELLPVPASAWTVEQLPNWRLRYRVDYDNKTHDYFDQDQILHLRGPSLNGYDGLPAIRLAREAIGLSQALEKQQAGLVGAGAKPSGILSFKNAPGAEARAKLQAQWQKQFAPGGQGGIAILDGDAEFSSLTMTSVDGQFLETRQFQIEEIGRAFRVLPVMMMQTSKTASFSSWEQMLRMHITNTLGPWEMRWEQALNRDVLGNAPGLTFDMDERELLRGDFAAQADYYTKALGAGGQPAWMTQDEVREEVGLNPYGGFAARLSPGAMSGKDQGSAAAPDQTTPPAAAPAQ